MGDKTRRGGEPLGWTDLVGYPSPRVQKGAATPAETRFGHYEPQATKVV